MNQIRQKQQYENIQNNNLFSSTQDKDFVQEFAKETLKNFLYMIKSISVKYEEGQEEERDQQISNYYNRFSIKQLQGESKDESINQDIDSFIKKSQSKSESFASTGSYNFNSLIENQNLLNETYQAFEQSIDYTSDQFLQVIKCKLENAQNILTNIQKDNDHLYCSRVNNGSIFQGDINYTKLTYFDIKNVIVLLKDILQKYQKQIDTNLKSQNFSNLLTDISIGQQNDNKYQNNSNKLTIYI